MPSAAKWLAWSKDNRSGRWMVVNEGLKRDITSYVERLEQSAKKHGITASFVALPEGIEPDA